MDEEYLRGIRDTWYWVAVLAVIVLLVAIIVMGARRRARSKKNLDTQIDVSAQAMSVREAQLRYEEAAKLSEATANLNRAATGFGQATQEVLLFLAEERAERQQALAKLERTSQE